MADLGGWGSIYCKTWWGDRSNIQYSLPVKPFCLLNQSTQDFINRVEADGGIVEEGAIQCLDNAMLGDGKE